MLRLGPYELVREIAKGGMAEVYLARVTGLAGFEKYVALKTIHPEFANQQGFIALLVNEAKLAVQLEHPNIAQTFDLGRVGDTYYMTMEYIDGIDVFQLLRAAEARRLRLPFDVCAFIARDVAAALDYAHARCDTTTGLPLGIVHRDVSPENVMISWEGNVKLVDFGVAKATQSVSHRDRGITGKLRYLSPELAWMAPVDGRSDIYSAGIVLYEMITGRPLFLEDDFAKAIALAREGKIIRPRELRPEVPAALERIVLRSLAPASADRYQHAEEMAADLQRFLRATAPGYTTARLAALVADLIAPPAATGMLDDVTERQLSDGEIVHEDLPITDENSMIRLGDQIGLAFDLVIEEPTRFDRFELHEQLGTSVLASVHRATVDGTVVALKRFSPLLADDPAFGDRFVADLSRCAQLRHPNLVEIVDLGRRERTYFVATRFVDGIPLARILHRAGPAPHAVAVAILGQLLDALVCGHAPHGGVTPSNVMITRDGEVKLGDLGVARLVHGLTPIGTEKLGYTAPEVIDGSGLDVRDDVFGVGVIAWELITGKRLFDAPSHRKRVAQLRALEIAPPSLLEPSCEPSLEMIVMAALGRRRAQRLASPAAMRAALEPFIEHARALADVVGWAFAAPDAEPALTVRGTTPAPELEDPSVILITSD